MENVLIIANQFAPMGGSGVQRTVKFVKYLRKFDFEPIVFTRQIEGIELIDNVLLKDIPKDIKIIRTTAFEPSELKGALKVFGKAFGKLLIPDSSRIWCEKSKKILLETIQAYNIRLIYTTSAPYSDHLLGLYVKKRLPHVKWVCDFRDEWTNNPYTLDNPHSHIRTKIEKKMEKDVLLTADYLITNTPVMKQNFLNSLPQLYEKYFDVIPNGYDEDDFSDVFVKNKKNKKFTLVYTGALYGRRKPDNLFQAIKNLKEKKLIKEHDIVLKLIGNYHNNKLQKKINFLQISNQVEIVGYLSHDLCIKEQLSADCLVLLEGSGVGSNAFYTGKIFEYMNTNRPVLAFIPDGVAKDLILEINIGKVANIDSVSEIENLILNYYKQWEKGEICFEPNKDKIKNYERKVLTKKLAKAFKTVLK